MSLAPPRPLRLALASLIGACLAVAPVVAFPAQANTAGTGVVINEAYLSGGSAGAAFTNKFVELYNPTNAAIDLSSWSLQYRKATGTVADKPSFVALTGTIPAKGYYLVSGGSNGANGAALPTPDQTSTLNPSGTTGTLILANSTSALTLEAGDSAANPAVIDLLGYGASLTFEGAVATAPTGNADVKSFNRSNAADTDNNAADISLSATITPTNTAGPTGGTPTPVPTETPEPVPTSTPPTGVTAISAIQGTEDASPLAGTTVNTVGVVTAAYPSGGFAGFYLQTPGTGSTTGPASHGIFVYTKTLTSDVAIGDYVSVTGAVSEYYGLTQLTINTLADIVALDGAGITAPVPATLRLPATDADRERLEGMLVAPAGDYTVTNNYTTNQYAEIGLAAGTTPLVNPTVTDRPGSTGYTAAIAANAARAITLDDGASTNYLNASNQGKPVPYLSTTAPVRIGAPVSFTKPMVLDYRNSAWKLQPTTALVPANAATVQPATFANTRTAAPEDVGGDIRLGTFNVLNYFSTTGDTLTGCQYYTDRAGAKTTVSGGCDARGAADQANFKRQQAKIVAAINALDAQVISLEEIENSAVFGVDRDTALATLVAALNADLGQDAWAFVPSPTVLPANEDVIRTAFIYQKAAVETVGGSTILTGSAAFSNARQPLAQAFQLVGDSGSTFLTIVNHFKSKGSGTGVDADMGDGQGASNASRVNQATALVAFADSMSEQTGIDRVFLTGDFNAYDQEDPIKVITDAGYLNQEAKSGEYTYAFGGSVGSLDHVFASAAADAVVTDVDVWNINSVESVALEYSRYNNNVTDFYVADPYRSSDHDPAILGLNLATPTTEPTPVPTTPPTAPTTPPTAPTGQAPAAAPTSAPESALTEALRDRISTDAARYTAGSAITVTAGATHAGEFVSVWVRSTPVNLSGWLQANAAGAVTTTLPKDLAVGTHRIILQDAAGAVIGWTEITIVASAGAAANLANTGVETTSLLAGAGLLLLLGGLLARRRRSNATAA